MNHAYQPLHQKYRPERFDSLVGQEAITTTLKEALKTNRIAPAYLFSGPRGTGKTSSARILARSLNCTKSNSPTINPCGECDLCKAITVGTALDVIEIDAASNTGVENIRELIERSRFSPVQARWKVYVIDECHMLSTAAFNALLKTLEEPPANVVFILATTDPQRVIPTILSRCMRFDFRSIPLQTLKQHLSMIASKEGIQIENEALLLIARRSQGGLRDAESMLDQLSLLPPPIKISSVWDLLGAIPEEQLLKLSAALINKDPKLILNICRELTDHGKEPIAILQGLASILRDLVVKKTAPDYPDLCSFSAENGNKLEEVANQVNLDLLLKWQSSLKGSEQQLRNSMQPRLWLEILLLGILSNAKGESTNTDTLISENQLKPKQDINKNTALNNANTDSKKSIEHTKEALDKHIESNQINTEEEKVLEKTWNKILSMLELPSTKMLLSQQATLISVRDNLVEISVSSKWISMIESRQSLIEAAIEKALGSQKKVIFKSQIENRRMRKEVAQTKNPNLHRANLTTREINDNSEKESHKAKPNNMESSGQSLQEAPPEIAIDKKAKQLADFFNGKIINPNE